MVIKERPIILLSLILFFSSDEKPFKCGKCGTLFRQSGNLTKHFEVTREFSFGMSISPTPPLVNLNFNCF